MNTFGMNIAVGAVLLFLQAPAYFPQGNILVAIIIGTVLMAFTLLWVYATFAAAMPSSGAVTTCLSVAHCIPFSAGCLVGVRGCG
jgi:amino acid transporter